MPNPQDAVDFMQQVQDAETSMRVSAVNDLRFRYGEQWPQYAVAARGLNRPQLTINEVDGYCRQVHNNIRQQRPRMSPHPTGARGSIEAAKIIKGVLRHIEVNSAADNAYDIATDYAITMGVGYFRILTDFISETSFDQDIYIRQVDNPFAVYFDTNSIEPDGSDAQKALLTCVMSKDDFKLEFPGAKAENFTERGTGDSDVEWVTEYDVRLAEYFYVDRKAEELVQLNDGSVMFASELPISKILELAGFSVVGSRPSYRRIVKWQKQTAFEVLDEKDLVFRWIPIVPVYGVRTIIEGKRDRFGLVRFAKDPQTLVNFWNTTITETLAMAPKPKWLLKEGQDEGYEQEWQRSNIDTQAVLHWKNALDGTGEVPQRIAPEPPPEGAIAGAMMASQHLQRVVGIFDPLMNQKATDPKSGRALRQEQMQSDNSNFHFYDNLTRSLMHAGRICLSGFKIYDVERVMRIIGDDGRPKLITANKKVTDEAGNVVNVLNDLTGADQYDIVMETGPGYDTKRQEGVESMMQLLATPLGEQVAQVGGDLVVRMMDFPGADSLADRMAAANPFSKVDDQEDVQPEQLKMKVAGLEMQLQKAQKVIQEQGLQLKYRGDIEQMRQEGETRRTLMKTVSDSHDTELRNQSMQHSTETKAISEQNKAEIDALVKLALAGVNTDHLRAELAQRDRELNAKIQQDTTAIT